MGAILAATLPPLVWLIGTLAVARVAYQSLRPSTVPLCSKDHEIHLLHCYVQEDGCTTTAGALVMAVLFGSIWPVYVVLLPFYALAAGLRYVITGRTPELPAEKEARLRKDVREADDA